MQRVTRREFIAQSAAVLGGAAVFGMAVAPRAEAQQIARVVPVGEQQVMPLPFAAGALKGISEEQITLHHDRHYAGYVKNRNDIEKELAAMDRRATNFDAKRYAGIQKMLTFNVCGQVLHENYFTVLGGDGAPVAGSPVLAAITRDFGSVDGWKADLTAAATAAGVGWGVTCWEPSAGRLVNYVVELHQYGAVWNATPVIALDGWEHAYYHDHGPDKAKYFDAFFANLHWGRIGQVFQQATTGRA
ncbi:MAG: superoxide dismutase [Armatimonadota bacterium]